MPVKSLPSSPSLDHLKYQAKDLLASFHAGNPEALARVREFHPKHAGQGQPPPKFALGDAQWVIAREYGFESWPKLKLHLESLTGAAPGKSAAVSPVSPLAQVAQFLEFACPDHHVRGGFAHVMARNAAARMLRRHPEITRDNLYTSVVCGELDEVNRILATRPEAANEKPAFAGPDRSGSGNSDDLFKDNGPKLWEPLLYLCFTRLPIPAVTENSVAIAQALLDRGANPNAFFMAGDSRYTPLVGVIGEGEESRPAHTQRDALARLLLERGANPFDIQVVYNIHFRGDVLWFLKLAHEQSVNAGREAAWQDPAWSMFDMGGYGSGARWHLALAVKNNDLELAEWCLAHGANPNAGPPRAQTLPQQSLHAQALQSGLPEMAALLERFGAKTSGSTVQQDAFRAACFRLDRAGAQRLAQAKPEYLLDPAPMRKAAEQDRADVIELLLDLGMSPDIEDPKEGNQRPLHAAAYSNAARAAKVLIQAGAEIDNRESNHHATPLGFAIWSEAWDAIEMIAPRSREVWNLVFLGKVERLREVLVEKPELAKSVSSEGETLLMQLPDDDGKALEIARLLLSHGANPSARNMAGLSAADLARKRGLEEVAALLESPAPSVSVIDAPIAADENRRE